MKRLTVSQADIDAAAGQGLIPADSAPRLWSFLQDRITQRQSDPASGESPFTLSSLSWYSGAVILLLAMSWLDAQFWDTWNGGAMALITAVYTCAFAAAGARLWKTDQLRIPGGVFITLAAALTPVFVMATERVLGLWSLDLNWRASAGLELSVATSLALSAWVGLRSYKFPLLSAPLTLGLMGAVMSAYSLLSGAGYAGDNFMLGLGVAVMGGAFIADRSGKQAFTFWPYLFGAITAWGAFTDIFAWHGSEAGMLFYAVCNVGMMLASVILARRIFVVLGAIGAVGYLSHLTWTVFAGSMLFPVVMSVFAIGVIWGGVYYQRNEARIDAAILGLVPSGLRQYLPERS